MSARVLGAASIMILAAAHAACSGVQQFGAEPDADPYAGCVDLGDLALTSSSRPDAQDRMEARVRELGGDTLLFGERGRSRRLNQMPEEIVKRRDELRPPRETRSDEVRVAGAVDVQSSPAELWYYGAALRCKQPDEQKD